MNTKNIYNVGETVKCSIYSNKPERITACRRIPILAFEIIAIAHDTIAYDRNIPEFNRVYVVKNAEMKLVAIGVKSSHGGYDLQINEDEIKWFNYHDSDETVLSIGKQLQKDTAPIPRQLPLFNTNSL